MKISRRNFLGALGALTATSSLPLNAKASISKKKPNVLFLMSDEHSPHVVGCYNNNIVKTPHLDELASQGQVFKSTYCQNPICVPSRASIVTGRLPSHVNVFGNAAETVKELNGEPITLANVFRKAGYDAQWFGKEHWGGDNAGLGFGSMNEAVNHDIKASKRFKDLRKKTGRLPQKADTYDFSIDEDEDAIVAKHAINYLEEYGQNPFFLGVSFRKPHFPFLVHEDYYDTYKDDVGMPRVTEGMLDNLPAQNKKHREKYKIAEMSEAQTKKARGIYYGMVDFIDDQVGRILNKLDELGLREETIILYISDLGEMAGEHGLWYKNAFYEASAAVPMIWSYPEKISKGKRVKANVSLTDVFPTLCELCNIDIPSVLEGKSLMSLMKGTETGNDRIVISETYSNPNNPGKMIRKGEWKYCWFQDENCQLFNIEKDPSEEFNLIKEPKYARLIEELHAYSQEGFIPAPKIQKKKKVHA